MFLTNLVTYLFLPEVLRFHSLTELETPLHMLNATGVHTAVVTVRAHHARPPATSSTATACVKAASFLTASVTPCACPARCATQRAMELDPAAMVEVVLDVTHLMGADAPVNLCVRQRRCVVPEHVRT